MEESKKVVKVQTWTVTQREFEDGTKEMHRLNDGFTAFELLGLSDFLSHEIRLQLLGQITPDSIKREFIEK